MKRLARWPAGVAKWRLRAFMALVALGVFLMVVMAVSPWWETRGVGVSPAEANATIHQRFAIPASAWDVCFSTSPRDSMVTFRVEPADFDAWARTRGFRVTAIKPGLPAPVFAIHSWGEVEFGLELLPEGGVSFDQPGECFISGVYDPRRRRCQARFSCK